MGCGELIESLRNEGEEKVVVIWREAEEKAGKIRAEILLRLEEIRMRSLPEQGGVDVLRRIFLEAGTKARYVRLTSEDTLSQRLYHVAAASLHLLREREYAAVFEKLVLQLPPAQWYRVRVNPADQSIAAKFFPQAKIVADSSITGGLVVEDEGGDISVINSFEKRLERAWPQMLPGLLKDLTRNAVQKDTA
ncbi:MAG: hypothetical protein C0402_04560 [Thermodesulfovibrio sp.]|nr:hypothetical protein [Thermodesulfovibrio sp.]